MSGTCAVVSPMSYARPYDTCQEWIGFSLSREGPFCLSWGDSGKPLDKGKSPSRFRCRPFSEDVVSSSIQEDHDSLQPAA